MRFDIDSFSSTLKALENESKSRNGFSTVGYFINNGGSGGGIPLGEETPWENLRILLFRLALNKLSEPLKTLNAGDIVLKSEGDRLMKDGAV
ncbi:hypothetical protein CEXT_341631 [Caerostris extrusa]|uniref:Uncharacterized protein n=1 Tax=Caerostris extrusa TaxID=172846 RepID=A0AAV4P200_CAEEX|nr:hypothetical protein CEXT_341631 [Caerostris extrusa]